MFKVFRGLEFKRLEFNAKGPLQGVGEGFAV